MYLLRNDSSVFSWRGSFGHWTSWVTARKSCKPHPTSQIQQFKYHLPSFQQPVASIYWPAWLAKTQDSGSCGPESNMSKLFPKPTFPKDCSYSSPPFESCVPFNAAFWTPDRLTGRYLICHLQLEHRYSTLGHHLLVQLGRTKSSIWKADFCGCWLSLGRTKWNHPSKRSFQSPPSSPGQASSCGTSEKAITLFSSESKKARSWILECKGSVGIWMRRVTNTQKQTMGCWDIASTCLLFLERQRELIFPVQSNACRFRSKSYITAGQLSLCLPCIGFICRHRHFLRTHINPTYKREIDLQKFIYSF